MKMEYDIELAPFTTLGVGGKAKYFLVVDNKKDLEEGINFAKDNNLPIFVLGEGSNVLVSDDGFEGLVIKNKLLGIRAEDNGKKCLVYSGAGEKWDRLVEFTVSQGFAGLESLSGIPGSVGASPVQNIGAYGQDVSKTIVEVTAFDTKEDRIVKLLSHECGFGYRKSIFNTIAKGRYVILEVVFELNKGGEPEISYQDLVKYFENKPKPDLKQMRDAVMEIRARKGMVIDDNYESYKSAGSFFKNPIVSKDEFDKIRDIVGYEDSKWYWPQSEGSVKLSAAKLIELAGFLKGFKMGRAGISPKHALSIINLGGATASEIVSLAKTIISGVKERFGVEISPEVLLIGFKDNPFKI